MSKPDRRTSGQAVGLAAVQGSATLGSVLGSAGPLVHPSARPACNRCGFAVISKPWGCKNPCLNCGTVYPLGDCSD